MSSTLKCIKCGEKATSFGGHVHNGEEKIIAGFCNGHFKKEPRKEGCKGCYGEWNEAMGIDEYFCTVWEMSANGNKVNINQIT